MARFDSIGFFWQDIAKVKPPKKEKPKSIPPVRFWTEPDYLPGLEEAKAYRFNLYSDMELWQAAGNRERLVFDIESYPNYSLIGFRGIDTHKIVYFEIRKDGGLCELGKLQWIFDNFTIINFNGITYDFVVAAVALAGKSSEAIYEATRMLIELRQRPKEVYKRFKVKKLAKVDQIDLIELTSLAPGLKICAGRLHAPKLQDLPFEPGTILTEDQIIVLRRYWVNDLDNTEILYRNLTPQIELREKMGIRYGIDLRSLSDAQMAEAIIGSEIRRTTGQKHLQRTKLPPNTSYKYQTPHFIKYSSALMNHVLALVQSADFKVAEMTEAGGGGSVIMPPELAELVIEMGNCKYKFGIGGLHSREKQVAHIADDDYFIADTDATSYYPRLILNAGIAPENLGRDFLVIYNGIVVERVSAKEAGNIIVAECLKIVANGTFGKLGSPWSIVYAPNLMIQVTITGQLSILMLAERFELAGIEVTSVNTDGIVVKCARAKEHVFKGIVAQWEAETGFGTEEVRYAATYSKDINNYIAVYEKPQKGSIFKLKGAYAKTSSKKNAVMEITIEAVKEFIATGKPVAETIRECRDITKFTIMRHVNGGAVKGDPTPIGEPVKSGIYLGKLVRWYYAEGVEGDFIYAKSGNKVPLTDGAKPCMDLPAQFPGDIDYAKYEQKATDILYEIGYLKKVEKENEIGCEEVEEA